MEGREMAAAAAAAAASSGGGGGGGFVWLPPPNPSLPHREDCWSEGETAALVDAWGSRYVELNRGNLRQKHWQEVANAVNSRRGAAARRRPPRTALQCKNRVHTIKKKYKEERVCSAPSSWSFFDELDRLVGPTLNGAASKRPSPALAPHLALPVHLSSAARKYPSPSSSPSPPTPMVPSLPNYRRGAPLPSAAFIQQEAAAAASVSDSEDSGDHPRDNNNNNNNNNLQRSPSRSVSSSRSGGRNKRRVRRETGGDGDSSVGELARAIDTFAETYERVESAKQKHSLEMARGRIDFLKQLEVKRMESFVDAHEKLAGASDGTSGVELISSVAELPFLSNSNYL